MLLEIHIQMNNSLTIDTYILVNLPNKNKISSQKYAQIIKSMM